MGNQHRSPMQIVDDSGPAEPSKEAGRILAGLGAVLGIVEREIAMTGELTPEQRGFAG